jgi:cyclomaltodextrinase / maltogenic alpha-amylase / neopullulanase
MSHWARDAFFYHIYPIGFCAAPLANDFHSAPSPRLEKVHDWIDHLKNLGVNALYLGPVFESTSHGYDTADYFQVDRRLGTRETLRDLVAALHRVGIRVLLDGVFNHVGRDFWAFKDVILNQQGSSYCGWFRRLRFEGRSPYNDPFQYGGWNGHYDLIKLNLENPAVKAHLFEAIAMWVRDFDIDGLRLDAADHIDPGFLRELASFCRTLRSDLWLMGEVVHGDYRQWVGQHLLDSVTNYECYKGLYSSHVDRNYFEIAYALNRQFGQGGLYRELPLYAFADNHDVDRVASRLSDPGHLYPLYCLLLTMPGVPSLYSGSEFGIHGRKNGGDDKPLRPALDLHELATRAPNRDLLQAIQRLSQIRKRSEALRRGQYQQIHVGHEQFSFARWTDQECVIVVVNGSHETASLDIAIPEFRGERLVDLLSPAESFAIRRGKATIDPLWPCWSRILSVR